MIGYEVQFLSAVIIAIVTAIITVQLALRRFYKEKWWEAKMRSYTDIIHALHHMKRDLDISIPAEYEQAQFASEFRTKWEKLHQEAWDTIKRNIDVGEFVISEEATLILSEMVDSCVYDPNGMYVEYLEASLDAVNTCLPKIKDAARKDLNLPKKYRPTAKSTEKPTQPSQD